MEILADLRFALGQMRKRWVLTLAAVVTLALCIGVNTAIFSVFNATLLRPLPFPESDRIVEVFNSYPSLDVENAGSNRALYTTYKERVDAINSFALIQGRMVTFGGSDGAERLRALRVTPDFFSTMRMVPELGEAFRTEHGLPGSDRVVLLTHGFWESAFGGDHEVVGRELQLDGVSHTILGVLPESFRQWNAQSRVVLPYTWNPARVNLSNPHANYATLVGRIAEGATIEQAQGQVDAIDAEYRESHPRMVGFLDRSQHKSWVRGHQEEQVRPIWRRIVVLQAFAFAILLIGAVNVANLRMAEVASRERELTLRRVLGGSSGALLRQLLVEAGLLAVIGGILGVLCGWLSLGVLRDSFSMIVRDTESITIDGAVLTWSLLLVLVTILVVGLSPARILWRLNFQVLLQDGARGTSTGRGARLRAGLGIFQTALAVLFLILTVLFVRSFMNTSDTPLGFDAERVTTFTLSMPETIYPGRAARIALVSRVLEGLQVLPGVEQVAAASFVPAVTHGSPNWTLRVRGEDLADALEQKSSDTFSITEGFFETMGIKLLEGRGIEITDTADSREVFVVDRRFRDRFLPDGAVGGQFGFGEVDRADDAWPTVVGEATPIIHRRLMDDSRPPLTYRSYYRSPSAEVSFFMRSERPHTGLLAEARQVVSGIDPQLPLDGAGRIDLLVHDSLGDWRAILRLTLLFAAVAIFLTMAGIFGIQMNNLNTERRNTAIRAALGASPASLLRRALLRGLSPMLIGLAIGLVLAAAITPQLEEILTSISPRDPVAFALVALFIPTVTVAVLLAPAMAAARRNPARVLQEE